MSVFTSEQTEPAMTVQRSQAFLSQLVGGFIHRFKLGFTNTQLVRVQ